MKFLKAGFFPLLILMTAPAFADTRLSHALRDVISDSALNVLATGTYPPPYIFAESYPAQELYAALVNYSNSEEQTTADPDFGVVSVRALGEKSKCLRPISSSSFKKYICFLYIDTTDQVTTALGQQGSLLKAFQAALIPALIIRSPTDGTNESQVDLGSFSPSSDPQQNESSDGARQLYVALQDFDNPNEQTDVFSDGSVRSTRFFGNNSQCFHEITTATGQTDDSYICFFGLDLSDPVASNYFEN